MEENKNIPQEPVFPEAAPFRPDSKPFLPAYTPPPKLTFPTGKGELTLGAAAVAFSLLLCNCLFFAGLDLGFAAGVYGSILCALAYLLRRGYKPGRYPAALLVLCLLIAGAFPRSDDLALKILSLPGLLLVPGLAFCLMAGQNQHSPDGILSLIDSFRTLFLLGCGKLGASCRGIRQACSTGTIGKRGSSVALGLLIAIPLLAILIPLLISADAAFEGLLKLLPELKWQELVITCLFGIPVGAVLYTRSIALHHLPRKTAAPIRRRGLNAITVNTVLICTGIVYVAYLISQLAYFAGGFSGILPEEYTLAQYARRGFFEMAWLGIINLTVISLAMGLVSARETPKLLTKVLCLFLGLVTLFLVSTASAKMLLYIDSYGLTQLRVLTQVFMLWLALSTVFVCIWLFRPKTAYMKAALLSALALFAALLWVDVDTQVAKYNVHAYRTGKLQTVDVGHLNRLSDGAVPYLYELTGDADEKIAEKARTALRTRDMEDTDLRSWNYSRAQAAEILQQFHLEEAARFLGTESLNGTVKIIKNTYSRYDYYGEFAAAIRLSAEDMAGLQAQGSMTRLPLPESLQSVLYGSSNNRYKGPYFINSYSKEILIPTIENGAYCFCDRHTGSTDPKSPATLHARGSMNFTLAVLDSDTGILYFFMKDT